MLEVYSQLWHALATNIRAVSSLSSFSWAFPRIWLSGAGSVPGLTTLILIQAISGGFLVLLSPSIATVPKGP